jgi:hypothetical protein
MRDCGKKRTLPIVVAQNGPGQKETFIRKGERKLLQVSRYNLTLIGTNLDCGGTVL